MRWGSATVSLGHVGPSGVANSEPPWNRGELVESAAKESGIEAPCSGGKFCGSTGRQQPQAWVAHDLARGETWHASAIALATASLWQQHLV